MLAFIVGNGTSLAKTDMDLLIGKPSYACNRINLIYNKTTWRPDVYVHPKSLAPDLPYIQENVSMGIPCYLGEHYAAPPVGKLGLSDALNIHWIKDCHHHLVNFDNLELPDEWHLPQFCSFGGSVNVAMQIAVQDGFDDLVLVGCDLEYKDKKPSHFDPAYEHGGEQPAFYAAKNALFGHIQALNWIRRKGNNVSVRNATVGGLLESGPALGWKMSRIFLIGNGASLTPAQLDLLKGQDCMATNKIHLIYDKTDWRPTHYVKVDYSAFDPDDWEFEILNHVLVGEKCLLWDAFRRGADPCDGNYEYINDGIGDFRNVTYIPRCHHTNEGKGAWHLPEICSGQNSILPMIQWAVTLKYDEIYLLGCDGWYEKGKDHFSSNYRSAWDETYVSRNTQKTREAHEVAREGCPIPVYNCTSGSVIDVWPRRKLSDVLNRKD